MAGDVRRTIMMQLYGLTKLIPPIYQTMKTLTNLIAAALFLAASIANAEPLSAAGYDAKANPDVLLQTAVNEARASNKQVLVVAGGPWCRWCMALEDFVSRNKEVKTALNNAFVPVEIYYGQDNTNEKFFAKLPKAKGYPHFWVVDKDGKVTKSINTGNVEDGHGSYDKEKLLNLIAEMSAS